MNTIFLRFKDLKSIVGAVVYENQFKDFYFVEFFLNRFLYRRKLLTSKGIFDKNLISWAENYKLNLNLFFQRKKFYEEGSIFFRRTVYIPESNKFRFFLELLLTRSFLIFQLNIFIFLYFFFIIVISIFFFDWFFSFSMFHFIFIFFVVFFFPFFIRMSLYYLQKRLKIFGLGLSLLFFRPTRLTLCFNFSPKKELFLRIALTRMVIFSTILGSSGVSFFLFFCLFLFQIFSYYFFFDFFVNIHFYVDFFFQDYFLDRFFFFHSASLDFFFLFFGFDFDILLSLFSWTLTLVFFLVLKIFFYNPLIICCLRYRTYLIIRLVLFLLVPSSIIIFLWIIFNKFVNKKYLFIQDDMLLKLPFHLKININTLKHEVNNTYVFYSIENKLLKNFFAKKNRD